MKPSVILAGTVALFALLAISSTLVVHGRPPTVEPANITFKQPAMRMPLLLSKISDQTGLKLHSSGFEDEVVLIHVEDVPVDQLLEKIAQVTSAQWRRSEGAFHLSADTRARSQERRDLENAVREQLADDREDLSKSVELIRKNPKAFVDSMRKFDDYRKTPFDDSPENMRLQAARHDIALAIPLSLAVQASLGQRLVFASNPNSLQLPMPEELRRAVNDYLDAYISKPKEDEYLEIDGETEKITQDVPPLRNPNQVHEAIVTVERPIEVLNPGDEILNPGKPARSLSVMLTFFNDEGQTLHQEWIGGYGIQMFLEVELYEADAQFVLDAEKTAIDEAKADKRQSIRFRPESIERLKTLAGTSPRRPQHHRPSKEFLGMMADIENNDPHSFENTDALVGFASQQQANLVAGISDVFRLPISSAPPEEVSFGRVRELVRTHYGPAEVTDGWLVLKPRFAEPLRAWRTSRSDLARAHRAGLGTPHLPLAVQMEFATRNPRPNPLLVTTNWVGRFAPGLTGGYSMFTDYWGVLRTLGRLRQVNRNAVIRGEDVPFKELTGDESRTVKEAILAGDIIVRQRTEVRDWDFLPPMSFGSTGPFGGSGGGYEPTEVVAEGLPPDGMISISIQEVDAVLVADADGNPLPIFPVQPLERFAGNILLAEKGWFDMRTYDRVRLATQRQYTVSFRLGGRFASTTVLLEDVVPDSSPLITRDQLPAGFRSRLDEKLEQLRELQREHRPPPRQQRP